MYELVSKIAYSEVVQVPHQKPLLSTDKLFLEAVITNLDVPKM